MAEVMGVTTRCAGVVDQGERGPLPDQVRLCIPAWRERAWKNWLESARRGLEISKNLACSGTAALEMSLRCPGEGGSSKNGKREIIGFPFWTE